MGSETWHLSSFLVTLAGVSWQGQEFTLINRTISINCVPMASLGHSCFPADLSPDATWSIPSGLQSRVLPVCPLKACTAPLPSSTLEL